MQKLLICGQPIDSDNPALQSILESVYASKERPLCMCKKPAIPMYLSKIHGVYYVKRMPDSGSHHTVSCESYEPPPELSGLGQVLGTAIQEDLTTGETNLKLDFALSKVGSRKAPIPSEHAPSSLETKGNKLTLRAFLNFLWDQAGLNRWSPAMVGKRTWFVVRKNLLLATQSKKCKGEDLTERLFVPETYKSDDALAIKVRRSTHLAQASSSDGPKHKLLILIAEVKAFADAHYGKKIIFKHLPDYHFLLDTDLFERIHRRYAGVLAIWNGSQTVHLIAVATFNVGSGGVSSIEEISFMLTNENWVPFETSSEQMLIEHLVKEERKFLKGLRFNMADDKPMASVLLTDLQPVPCALYITPVGASEQFQQAQHQLIQDSEMSSWIWNAASTQMPALPSVLLREHALETQSGI